MRDFLMLGSAPMDEQCVQVNPGEVYTHEMLKECKRYKKLLEDLFPMAEFGIVTQDHDFGSYSEVVVYFDSEDEESADIAFGVESSLPETWTGA